MLKLGLHSSRQESEEVRKGSEYCGGDLSVGSSAEFKNHPKVSQYEISLQKGTDAVAMNATQLE